MIVEAFTYIFDVLAGRLSLVPGRRFRERRVEPLLWLMPARACWAGPSVKVLRLLREPLWAVHPRGGAGRSEGNRVSNAKKTRLEHGGAWNFARSRFVSFL